VENGFVFGAAGRLSLRNALKVIGLWIPENGFVW